MIACPCGGGELEVVHPEILEGPQIAGVGSWSKLMLLQHELLTPAGDDPYPKKHNFETLRGHIPALNVFTRWKK